MSMRKYVHIVKENKSYAGLVSGWDNISCYSSKAKAQGDFLERCRKLEAKGYTPWDEDIEDSSRSYYYYKSITFRKEATTVVDNEDKQYHYVEVMLMNDDLN